MISIILPTYNRAHVIKRSISSVIRQTYRDFELIIVDDGSTDNTKEIVNEFEDRRIKLVISESNHGQAHARNLGINQAIGEYIAFIDSDDEWMDDKCELQIDYIITNAADLIYTDAQVITNEGDTYVLHAPRLITTDLINKEFNDYQGRNIFVPSVLLKRSTLLNFDLFNENLKALEDLDFFTRYALSFRMIRYPQPLFLYYYNDHGNVSTNPQKITDARLTLLNKYRTERALNSTFIAGQYEMIAVLNAVSGNASVARHYAIKAILTKFIRFRSWLVLFYGISNNVAKKPYQAIKKRLQLWKS